MIPSGHPQVRVIVHRGMGAKNPRLRENSLEALHQGLRVADGVETDLRRDLDGAIWLHHDPDVVTSDGRTLRIANSNTRDLEGVRVRGETEDPRLYKLARLEEVLNLLREPGLEGKVLHLEFKTPGADVAHPKGYIDDLVRNAVELVRAHGVTEQVRTSSFGPTMLAALEAQAPELSRRLLTTPERRAADQIARAHDLSVSLHGIHVGVQDLWGPHAVDPADLGRLGTQYPAVATWCTNDAELARRQLEALSQPGGPREIDLMTDFPEVITDVVRGR